MDVDELTGMETLAGGMAEVLFEPNLTSIAPLPWPGIALRVAVPEALAPPTTETGVIERDLTWKGFRARLAPIEFPP